MIRDTTAQRIAAMWHGGGGTALYQFASTGRIDLGPILQEIDNESVDSNLKQQHELTDLWEYVLAKGTRGVVPNWYERVICKGVKP
jgi:hypothetical protein